jgi:acyl-CoA thioester hydrolase
MKYIKYTETELIARYQETDKMGIIHHSVYPIWFEAGRTELIKACGYPYFSLEAMGLMLPLISLSVKYISPSYYEDKVIVKSSVTQLTRTRISIGYEVVKKGNDENILCTGTTDHVFTNRDLNPVNVSKKFPEVYEALNKIYERQIKA